MNRMWLRSLLAAALLALCAKAALAEDQPAGANAPAPAATAVTPNPRQKHNLEKADKPRFALKDIEWPAKAGEASICLWKDDCLAAASMGVDDNCASNLPWWMEECRKFGLRPTWWLVTRDVGKGGMAGTWDDWRKVVAAGYDVGSHSVDHLNHKVPVWDDMEMQYGDSKKAIEEHVGIRCLTITYPGGAGQEKNDPELAKKYYIAGRVGYTVVNPANNIEYMKVHATSAFTIDDPKGRWADLVTVFDHSPKNGAWRGWWVGFFHFIKEKDEAEVAKCEKKFAYIQEKVKSGELWLGLFREVAQYGQERDTAKLTMKSAAADRIVLDLTDEMDDALFDFPLTVKVRLDANWKSASATQNGAAVACKVVEHEGASFALVQVTPDRGEVTITPQAARNEQ
ncbi:MAG TPA: polysaccharide deacetylase family protein [Planctomycetota bacterium]|jgi:hypothetical protein